MESKIEFNILPKEEIESLWGDISSELSRADDDTATVEELRYDLLEDVSLMDLWAYTIDDKIKYYLIAQKIGRTYFILRVAGGGKHNPWELIVDQLKKKAEGFGCVSLAFCGDLWWEKQLEGLGFNIHQYCYTAPLLKEEVTSESE